MNEIKQKEIEEMADIILKTSEEYYRAKCCEECADFEAMALYNAGYRKQSDTVKEFAEKVNRKAEIECDSDFNISIYNLEALTETIAAEFGVEVEK